MGLSKESPISIWVTMAMPYELIDMCTFHASID